MESPSCLHSCRSCWGACASHLSLGVATCREPNYLQHWTWHSVEGWRLQCEAQVNREGYPESINSWAPESDFEWYTSVMSFHVSLLSNASCEKFTDNTNGWSKVQPACHLRLPEGRWEVGLVDMHISNTWHNITDRELHSGRRGTTRGSNKQQTWAGGRNRSDFWCPVEGIPPPSSDFYRSLATLLGRMHWNSQLYSSKQLLSLQSVLARSMIGYADNTSSMLLNPSKGDLPGFTTWLNNLTTKWC